MTTSIETDSPAAPTWPTTNAFTQTLLGFTYDGEPDTFSASCVAEFVAHDPTRYDYALSQIFEPAVLVEVALVAGFEPDAVESLQHAPTERMRWLADRVRNASSLSGTAAVTSAAALISVSRFALATALLDTWEATGQAEVRDRFEIAMLRFIIENRTNAGAGSAVHFETMRAAVVSGGIPIDRQLDACSQAVVWYLKRGELPVDEFGWFARHGNRLVVEHRDELAPGTVSSWFRGVAMVPADLGDTERTRAVMKLADHAADEAVADGGGAFEVHFKKTYLESSIKEHMYVARDEAKARAFGEELVALDPGWSASRGEVAEVRRSFGDLEGAVAAFDDAVTIGSPYIGYHLKSAADLLVRLDRLDEALARYRALAALGQPTDDLLRRIDDLERGTMSEETGSVRPVYGRQGAGRDGGVTA
ncbi:hypothetical protein AAEP80_03415 [Curtobacterium sp. L3-7]|uniref:hypothetical protein n=1 Tax=Curtobacterium sp. L3-7 TaxID=3138787 RepID=UPI003B527AA6